ncbi:gas vesicle protein [Pseudomonas putida]|uniref:gas vesicle accessory protein GvpU n=1 Tax=Pseudomonas putida TaxID=303 RepID=UPI0023648259|nr:gas vesicle accessory protein GvpU [Pseudomonas putida]MDD1966963.1 gas vesicle protein [Pseudomonas putida]
MSDKVEENLSDAEYFADVKNLKYEWDGRQTDWLLQWLVGFLNDTNLRIGITLTIGGSVITGTLIPHKAYFERLADDFSAPFTSQNAETAEALRTRILAFEAPDEADTPSSPAQYLHLQNARVHHGGNQLFPDTGTYWRGKIAAVEGFVLGELSMS